MKTINVTDWHIKTGEKMSCRHCPIANAITANLPVGLHAYLDEGWIYVRDAANQTQRCLEMPPKVQDFVRVFDGLNSDTAMPFSFDLDL